MSASGPNVRVRWGVWLVLLTLPLVSLVRVQTFASEDSLWWDAHRKAPAKVRPVLNIGNTFARRAQWRIAEGWYRDAWQLAASVTRPVYERQTGTALAMTNLAISVDAQGRHAESVRLIREMRAQFPRFREGARVAALIDP